MAYGYYEDPGTSFGNTGESTTQQNETYIQRQKRLQSKPAASQSTGTAQPSGGFQPVAGSQPGQNTVPAAGSTGTPVAGNGGIPPPTPAPAPAPAPAPQAAPAPAAAPAAPQTYNGGPMPDAKAGPDPFKGHPAFPNGGVYIGNGGWVPPDHPLAKQAIANQQKTSTAAGTAAPTTGTPGSALGGQAEAAKSGMFTQAAPPPHDFQNWQQLEMISNLLANPETMSPQVIAQMKQRSMEEALSMSQQLQQQQAEEAAASGFSGAGGRVGAQNRATQDTIMNAILGQNRDIEIGASQQNRQDQLQALGVAESILGGQVGRGSQVYSDILAGQQANRGDHWTGQQLALQRELGIGGLNIDQQRVSNQNRQFDAGHGLNILQFLEGQRQHDNSTGFNWATLNANQQGATMDRILQAIRG